MVETLDAANALVQRPAHDEPHHELDALRTRFAQVLNWLNRCGLLWRIDHEVHEAVIEFLVDQARAGTLQLVRHATGAEDHDAQVFRIRFHGPADRLPQFQTAVAGRWRVLYDVDRQRDHPARP